MPVATILLIEDCTEINENICELLELSGYRVFCANNGKQGLALAKAINPHLILCDILMPGMNGYEVIQNIMQNSETAEIPVVFLSARSEKNDINNGIKMGAKAYLIKPFGDKELFETVKQWIKS